MVDVDSVFNHTGGTAGRAEDPGCGQPSAGPRRGHDVDVDVVDPDPDWYIDNVLLFAEPGSARVWMPGPSSRWQAWWSAASTADSAVVRLAAQQGFVVTARQLRNLGFSRQQTRTLVRNGKWAVAGRGMVAPIDIRDPDPHLAARRHHAVRAAAAALDHADHVVSCRSAAILRGLPVFSLPSLPVLTDGEPAGLGRRAGAHIHGAALAMGDVTAWFGTPLTCPARTVIDIARHDRREGIVVADAALAERLVTRDELRAALDQARGWPGVRQARLVVELAADLAESPLESVTRLALVEGGFPVPDLQVRLGYYRVDMLFRERRLIVEADGLDKYTAAELRREKTREMRLRAMGYRIERVMWNDVVRNWPETRARLNAAFRLPA